MAEHALLSYSASKRWLSCTPSVFLGRGVPDTAGSAAKEGTLAHLLGELKLLRYKKRISPSQYEESFNTFTTDQFPVGGGQLESSKGYYSLAMLSHADDYATRVLSALGPGDMLLVEQRVSAARWVPESFGTMDAGIFSMRQKVFKIFDLKYGKGVEVDAVENTQLMLYALACYEEYSFLGDIEVFEFNIIQPRIDNYSTWSITVAELLEWAEDYVKPRALMAFNGEGETVAGDHCKFCPVKATCRTFANYAMTPEDYKHLHPDMMKPEEIVHVYERAKLLSEFVDSVDAHMHAEAMKGFKWPGYKIVRGSANRIISDLPKAVGILRNYGFEDNEIYQPAKLANFETLKALLKSEKEFNKVLGPVLYKPEGPLKLVPDSQKGEPVQLGSQVFFQNKSEIVYDDLDFLN